MQKSLVESAPTGSFVIEHSRSGKKTLKYYDQNRQVYLHSKYDPVVEASRWVELNHKEGKLLVVIGLGLGYHISALLDRLADDEYLLVIEPSEEIYKLAKEHGCLSNIEQHKQVKIVLNNFYVLECVIEELVAKGCFENNQFQILPGYNQVFLDEIENLPRLIKECFMSISIRMNTVNIFALSWQQNYLKNLKFALNATPFKKFENKFSLPVVIVAGGPSLAQDIELLKTVKNKVLIMCAGSAITSLEKYNITPHVIVSVDGGIPNYNHFKTIKNKDVPLFFSPTINHQILEEYPGEKVLFLMQMGEIDHWYLDALGFDPGFVEQGPSVANISLDIATKISSGPICLIGQDLGYTGGFSHAEGNGHRMNIEDMRLKGRALVETPSNDGSKIFTDYVYLSMKRWFEIYLSSFNKTNIYNATLKGAEIKGTKVIAFESFVQEFCNGNVDIESTIKTILDDKTCFECNEINQLIVESVDVLKRLERISLKGKEKSEQLLKKVKNNVDPIKIDKLLDDLEKIDKEIIELETKDALLCFLKLPLMNRLYFWHVPENFNCIEDRVKVAEKNLFFYQQLSLMANEAQKIMEEIQNS